MSNSATHSPGILEGLTVIDHTTALAGPYCAQILGDLGANVIKIEHPQKGDQSRGWGPFLDGVSTYFMGTNRNKKSLTLNLATESGRKILTELIKTADIVIHNVPKKSSRKKLGLDQETCQQINPRIIWTCISGFGDTGPFAEKPGYDVIIQGMSGTMAATGEAGSGPMRFPTPIADITTGLYTTIAILAALYQREKTGVGQCIDQALLDCQVTWLANLASAHLITNDPIKKIGNNHPSIVPYQPLPTADQWIIVGVGNENLWQKFLQVIEKPEWLENPKYKTNPDRLKHRQELVDELHPIMQAKPSAYWLEKLEQVRIPAAPILSPEDSLQSEQLLARGMLIELEHPVLGMVRSLGNPIHLSNNPISYRFPPPLHGEHTNEILQQLNYQDSEIEDLRKNGVIK